MDTEIDFLYLSERDMLAAGVLDALGCVEAMRETMSLFGKKDYLLGGPRADEHGLQVSFPATSDIPGFPLDDGPDRRFNAMPAYLGGRYHVAGQKWYGSNSRNLERGLPRSILTVTLNDVDTGAPLAHMSANLLSSMRTGAMPAMAASYLARRDSRVLSLVGPGVINKCAFLCYMAVLPELDTVKLRGSSTDSRSVREMTAFIEENYPQIKRILPCGSLEEACRDADVVSEAMSVTKQEMEEFKPDWFKKGATVFSMGTFCLREFDKLIPMRMVADNYGMYEKYLKNFIARGPVDELGRKREWSILGIDFVHLVNEKKVERGRVTDLADIVNGTAPGRTSEDEVVLCSIGGMPIEDLAWGYECWQSAREKGLGVPLKLWDEPYMK